jgi:hypothetical protein
MHYLINTGRILEREFKTVWCPLPWDAKLAWILFANNFLAIIILIELLVLKK